MVVMFLKSVFNNWKETYPYQNACHLTWSSGSVLLENQNDFT